MPTKKILAKSTPKVSEKPLSIKEREELAASEALIERGFKTFLEVGNALLTIKNKALHRETHKNFEDYCRERFDISRMHAHRQIRAVEVCALLPNGDTPRPENESQIRPLTAVPADKAPALWLKAVKEAAGRKVTAGIVQKVVTEWKRDSEGPTRKKAPSQWQSLCFKYLRHMRKHIAAEELDAIGEELERIRLLVEQIARPTQKQLNSMD